MSDRDGTRAPMPLSKVIPAARRALEQLTGRPVDSVTSAQREGDCWALDVDVVELERIPASTSVLGAYRVVVDGRGDLVSYERTARFYRNQATDGDLM